jgi:hypothetical protein
LIYANKSLLIGEIRLYTPVQFRQEHTEDNAGNGDEKVVQEKPGEAPKAVAVLAHRQTGADQCES